jgi:Gas vesicle protein
VSVEARLRPAHAEVALVDVLDRALAKGVALEADVTIAVADVELIRIGLRALVAAVEAVEAAPEPT